MSGNIFNIMKNEGIFNISAVKDGNSQIDFKLTDKSDPKVINSISEILRSLQNIDKNYFNISVEIGSITGNKIPVINLMPDNGYKLPMILFIHGFDTSKEKVLRYGIHFAVSGYFTVLIDLPDHGDRVVPDFDELYDLEKNRNVSWFNRLILMKKSLDEIKIIIDHYSALLEIDNSRIGMSGISMGGTITFLAAFYDQRIKVIAPFLSILGYESMAGKNDKDTMEKEKLKIIRSMDPLYVCDVKTNTAILAQFGANDKITERPILNEFENKLRVLYKECPERLNFIKHNDIGHDVSPNMIKNAVKWFEKFL
jgi:uncharacterized protein